MKGNEKLIEHLNVRLARRGEPAGGDHGGNGQEGKHSCIFQAKQRR